VYIYNAFIVENILPILKDITLQYHEVYRGDTIYITVNASDVNQAESDLTVEVQYQLDGGSWIPLTVTDDMYTSTGGGYWNIPFTPGPDWLDSQLGDYDFQGRVKNDAGGISDNGTYKETSNSAEVLNNPPEAETLSSEGDNVERGSTILILVNGDDLELGEKDLEVDLEYSSDGGSSWEDAYLEDPDYSSSDTRWEVAFSPGNGAELGSYDFRVRFFDGLAYSVWLVEEEIVTVTNAIPVVAYLEVSDDTMFRMNSVTLTAVVSDADQDTGTLTPDFQYQGPNDSNWVSQSGSNYFGSPGESGGKWEITFTPPANADVGEYSFRVVFTDSEDVDSDPYDITNALTINNAEPTVSIDKPEPGSKNPGTFNFEATAHDDEDNELEWLWDFGGGDTSGEESPSREFTKPGDYKITVTVTDDDGSEALDEVTITIKEEGGEFPLMLILLILIPLIVVILILVLLLTRKKKKPEAAPPPAMAPAPEAPPEAAPPAMAPPAASPAAPGSPPSAAPATAPMAAPSEAQNIKCPKCGTPFTVTDTTRPLTIECPNCHAKGTLK
jgi:DNA-directed RNA polymerase subunit RPC12/RpoP